MHNILCTHLAEAGARDEAPPAGAQRATAPRRAARPSLSMAVLRPRCRRLTDWPRLSTSSSTSLYPFVPFPRPLSERLLPNMRVQARACRFFMRLN
jgi:hypothetical protein